jgi:hypothetical protein
VVEPLAGHYGCFGALASGWLATKLASILASGVVALVADAKLVSGVASGWLAARIKRDRPDITERMQRGDG